MYIPHTIVTGTIVFSKITFFWSCILRKNKSKGKGHITHGVQE